MNYRRLRIGIIMLCLCLLIIPIGAMAEESQERGTYSVTKTATASKSQIFNHVITIEGGIMYRPMVFDASLIYVYDDNNNNHISQYLEGLCTAYRPVPADLYDCTSVEISNMSIGGYTGTTTSIPVLFDPNMHRAAGKKMTVSASFYSSYTVSITARKYMTSNCAPSVNSMTVSKTMGV